MDSYQCKFYIKSMSTDYPSPVFVFLGPPGCGKGSQAKKLAQFLQIPHISTGDLMRNKAKSDPALAEIINKGKFPGDEWVIKLLLERVADSDCREGYILDGFPRNLAQCKILDSMYKEPSQLIFINITLEDSIIIDRLSGRRTCQNCSKIFHVEFSPPEVEGECDDCLHPLYTRKDDQKEVIFDRLNLFKQQFDPMKAYYLNRTEWVDLSATGTMEECFTTLMEKLTQTCPHFFLMRK